MKHSTGEAAAKLLRLHAASRLERGAARAVALAEAFGADFDVVTGINRLEKLRLFIGCKIAVRAVGADAKLRGTIGEEAQDRGGRDKAVRIMRVVQSEPDAQITLGFLVFGGCHAVLRWS